MFFYSGRKINKIFHLNSENKTEFVQLKIAFSICKRDVIYTGIQNVF